MDIGKVGGKLSQEQVCDYPSLSCPLICDTGHLRCLVHSCDAGHSASIARDMIPIACLSPSGYSSLLLDYPLKTYSRRANHVQRRWPNR